MTSMIVKTTPELFKGNGVCYMDHLSENRLVGRSNRLYSGSYRFLKIGTIHCQRLSKTKTGLHRGTNARAILSPVSDPVASITQKVSLSILIFLVGPIASHKFKKFYTIVIIFHIILNFRLEILNKNYNRSSGRTI